MILNCMFAQNKLSSNFRKPVSGTNITCDIWLNFPQNSFIQWQGIRCKLFHHRRDSQRSTAMRHSANPWIHGWNPAYKLHTANNQRGKLNSTFISVFNAICAVFRTQRTLHFVITFPLFRFSAYCHVLFIYFVIQSLDAETAGLQTGSRNLQRKLRMSLLDQLLWCLDPNVANSNILPKKRKICCLRAAAEINKGPLHFQNHSRQKRRLAQCFEKDLLKSWQQNHNELNAHRDEVWVAKCLH